MKTIEDLHTREIFSPYDYNIQETDTFVYIKQTKEIYAQSERLRNHGKRNHTQVFLTDNIILEFQKIKSWRAFV